MRYVLLLSSWFCIISSSYAMEIIELGGNHKTTLSKEQLKTAVKKNSLALLGSLLPQGKIQSLEQLQGLIEEEDLQFVYHLSKNIIGQKEEEMGISLNWPRIRKAGEGLGYIVVGVATPLVYLFSGENKVEDGDESGTTAAGAAAIFGLLITGGLQLWSAWKNQPAEQALANAEAIKGRLKKLKRKYEKWRHHALALEDTESADSLE